MKPSPGPELLRPQTDSDEVEQTSLEGFRLSPQQRRVSSLQEGAYDQAYRAQCSVMLGGTLDSQILAAALQRLVLRNEILRTTFHFLADIAVPIQVISENIVVESRHLDLQSMDQSQQEARTRSLFQAIRCQPFDLERGPLLQVLLVALSTEKNLMLLSLPALCADSIGLSNLVREISLCYETCASGQEQLCDPIQYVDVSEYLNEILVSPGIELGRRYWSNQGLSVPQTPVLPLEDQRIGRSRFTPESHTLSISTEQRRRLETTARASQTTIDLLLLAAWQSLLFRLMSQPDVVIGVCYSGRCSREARETLGLLAQYLPIRVHLQASLCFEEILGEASRASREAESRQEYFSWEEVWPMEAEAKPRFLPFCFDFRPGTERFTAADISFDIQERYVCIDRFKLKLSCVQRDDRLDLEFHYDPGEFSAAYIGSLARRFQTLLASISDDCRRPIGELEIVQEVERHHLLVEFNDTGAELPTTESFHQLFQNQVGHTPERIALSGGELHLSYSELDRRSSKLSLYLRRLGIEPESPVAIYGNISVESLVGILGILKAGAAYLPLSPDLPSERLAFILDDARVSCVLTQRELIEAFPRRDLQLICLDEVLEEGTTEERIGTEVEVTGGQLAYVIYTSGSTGEPKGVLVEHRGLCNLPIAQIQAFDVRPDSRVLQFASFSFDASVSEIGMALLAGATLCVAKRESLLPGVELINLLREQAISVVTLPPSVLAILPGGDLPALRTVISAGEPCSANLVERWAPGRRFCNAYGPTETTVCATMAERLNGEQAPPIGRPIANAQVYLLDPLLQPSTPGLPGELHVGGIGLARGYLNRPDLTAERFIPDPFGEKPGTRLYKSGDWARYLQNGNIQFQGRIDHQVKIRGVRVELGEIESVLRQHLDVREAVVVRQEDEPGENRLVAYVVMKEKTGSGIDGLRRFLRDRLPAVMIPSSFVQLTSLPLTRNGKIDRDALPRLIGLGPELEAGYVAPQTEVEQTVASIWLEVLKLEKAGIHDSFFDLGGHSLLMIQVRNRLERAFNREVPMVDLFEHPTISTLARYLVAEDQALCSPDEERLKKQGDGRDRLRQRFERRFRV